MSTKKARRVSLVGASEGNELDGLVALRDRLARTLDESESARDIAALSRQYTDVLARIEAAKKRNLRTLDPGSTARRSPRDEVSARRAEREAAWEAERESK